MTPPLPPRVQASHPSQSGSILISLAGALLLLMILLGSIQIGYAYYQERELQKAADLAALSGVQVLSAGDCEKAKTRAFEIAKGNDPDLNPDEVESACGRWVAPEDAASTGPNFDPGATPHNGLQTGIAHKVPTLIPFITQPEIRVQATALSTEPVAAFSVGSRLLSLNSTGLLASILTGAGLDPKLLKVLDAAGVASIDITPSGLLQALDLPTTLLAGVGTPDQLARVKQLDVAELLTASLDLVKRSTATDEHIDVAVELIELMQGLPLLNTRIKLIDEQGLLAPVSTATLDSALNAHLNLLDVLSTSILLANGENFAQIKLPATPILGDTLTAAIQVVEPPTLAVGGVGTFAHSAQVRIYLRVSTDDLPIVGSLLQALGTSIDLPIFINVAQSKGKLDKVCTAPLQRNQAQFTVEAAVANMCVGSFPGLEDPNANSGSFQNVQDICINGTAAPHTLLTVAGIPVIQNSIALTIPSSSGTLTLTASPSPGQTFPYPPNKNQLLLSKAIIDSLVDGLVSNIPLVNIVLIPIATPLKAILQNTLHITLDTILNTLLDTLGLNLGETDVTLHSVQCGVPRLVE